MKAIRISIFCILLQVSNVYGASPEFYGIYADNNGKLYDLSEKRGDVYEFGQKVQFLVFQKNAETYANGLTIERAIFVRTVNNPGMDGRQPPKQVNLWKPRLNGAVETRTKPVANQPEQIYVVPRTPLSPGMYIVGVKGGGQEIGRFYVEKNRVTQNLQQGDDCIDIKVGSGWKSYEYDLNGGGGVSTPCLATFSAIGRFSGDGTPSGLYAVQLWRDPKVGIVGLLGYPVMEADTPTQVIESVKYSSANGSLSFQATFVEPYVWGGPGSSAPDENEREHTTVKFVGTLIGDKLRGSFSSFSDKKKAGEEKMKGLAVILNKDAANTDNFIYADYHEWYAQQSRLGRVAEVERAKRSATTELQKYADRPSMSPEDEKKWRLDEENRKKALPYNSELLQLKSEQAKALSVDNKKSLIQLSHKVLSMDPDDYESLDYLANLSTKDGSPEEALVYAALILKRGFITGRIFAEITFAYMAKKDIDNTLLWLEKTLQSNYPYAPTESMLLEGFPSHQSRISQLFEKYRTKRFGL